MPFSQPPTWPLGPSFQNTNVASFQEAWGTEDELYATAKKRSNAECGTLCRTNDPVSLTSRRHQREGGGQGRDRDGMERLKQLETQGPDIICGLRAVPDASKRLYADAFEKIGET